MKIMQSAITRFLSWKMRASMKACSRPLMCSTNAQSPEIVRPR